MALEIERKFLVVSDDWQAQVEGESVIKQGYLANRPGATVRVRVAGERAWLNIKGATLGICRSEYEYEIPLVDAEEMLATLVSGAIIHKVRYRVRCGVHLWDLDVFAGENQGLCLAEVELADEHESFERPVWAGREVSAEPRYYNASLIEHPYSTW